MTPEKVTTAPLPYLFYAPETEADTRLPLILFLHGSSERGDDLEKVKTQGLPELVANLPDAAFLVAPQCPENTR